MLRKVINKKVLALLLSSLFIFSAGCGTNKTADTKTATPSTTPAATDKKAETPASNEKIVLNIGIPTNPVVIDFETNKLTLLLEEKNNVDLKFTLFPTDYKDVKTKVSLLISSQSALPDVFAMGGLQSAMDDVSVMEYGSKGILVETTDYLNDPEITPNYNKLPQEIKDFVYNNTKLDGKNYGISRYTPQYWNEGPYRMWVNQEWMDNLKIEKPKTTEDFTAMLKAFVEKDPNGNGKKDEIGLIGNKFDSGWGNQVHIFLMNSFTYANPDKAYLHIKDGKIYPSFTEPGWLEGLTYMNGLVKDGLLSPLSYTQDNPQLKALASSDLAVTGVVAAGSLSTFGAVTSPASIRTNLLGPVVGPNGVINTSTGISMPNNFWFITKDCKNPEVAARVGDSLWDADMSVLSRFGERGVNFSDDPAVTSLWAPEQEGYKVGLVQLPESNIWNQPQNTHWQGNQPYYIPLETIMSVGFVPIAELETTPRKNFNPIYTKEYASHAPKENIMRIIYSSEELDSMASIKTAIDDYVKVSIAEFITGTRPLSDWDKYLKELDNMGLQEYIKASQDAYDRNK